MSAKLDLLPPATAYPYVSFFRWGSDALMMICVLARHVEASARLRVIARDAATVGYGMARDLEAPLLAAHSSTSNIGSLLSLPLRMYALQLGTAFAVGLALTVPWALFLPSVPPPVAEPHVHFPLWVPAGDQQELVYAVVYALCALGTLASTSVVMRISAKTTSVLSSKVQGKSLPLRLLKLKSAHSFYGELCHG